MNIRDLSQQKKKIMFFDFDSDGDHESYHIRKVITVL